MVQKILQTIPQFFTTAVEIHDEKPFHFFRKVNAIADCALAPLRYFTNHKPTVQITYLNTGEVYSVSEKGLEPKNWVMTACMVAAVFPCTIVGLVAKLVALTDGIVRKDIREAVLYREQQVALQAASLPLIAPYKEILDASSQFYEHLKANWEKKTAIWKEEGTQKMFNELFLKQAAFMDLLFTELARVGKNDPKRMAEILSMQPHNDSSEPLFGYCFFKASLWDSYHMARNFVTHVGPNNPHGPRRAFQSQKPTAETEAPFFTVGTMQAAWRKLYNEKAAKLDELRPRGDGNMQTMRFFFTQHIDRIDSRCNVSLDEKPVTEAANGFFPLPGCPTMYLPSCLK